MRLFPKKRKHNISLGLGNSKDAVILNVYDTINNESNGYLSEINISNVEMGTPLKPDKKTISSTKSGREFSIPLGDSPLQTTHRSNTNIEDITINKLAQKEPTSLSSHDHRSNPSISASKVYTGLLAIDNDTKTIKKFFHDLLVYINRNDCTLENDIDGEVENFVKQIPANELSMNFQTWILDKVTKVKVDFRKSVQKKLSLISKTIEVQKQYIENTATDEELVEIYKSLDV